MKRETTIGVIAVLILAVLSVASSPALAQPRQPPPAAAKDAPYGYIFTDDLLAGNAFDPNDVQIRVVGHSMRTTLLRLRTNFVPEMLVSVEKL
jgi:hypothetical protein